MSHHNELIQKLAACAAACEMCMDACLDEENIKDMVRCIRLDRDCAKICVLTASYVASHSSFAIDMVRTCEQICEQCAEECARHEHMEHCQICAEQCRECAEACRTFSNVTA
jgi:hypothetical protein